MIARTLFPLRLIGPGQRVAIFGCCAALLLTAVLLAGCRPIRASAGSNAAILAPATALPPEARACPVSEPLWIKPPQDAAVLNEPGFGYYFVNANRSIWASAPWPSLEESDWRAGEDGVKVGWFRPAGALLTISGQRSDGPSDPLHAHVPCCYPTRFQATGLFFPTPGCWQVTARAAESELTFTVWVEP